MLKRKNSGELGESKIQTVAVAVDDVATRDTCADRDRYIE
jgi:hypothetical protein